ncbi:MAG: hypothetical protein ACOX9C_12315 [Kiritimatiellia bacterium]|jgi:hypothetical protein
MKTKKISFAILFLASICQGANPAAELMSSIQYSDIAGVGTIEGLSNAVMTINVNNYWLGEGPAGLLTIANSGDWEPQLMPPPAPGIEPVYSEDKRPGMMGKTVVFFAMTNEWKTSSLQLRSFTEFDWGLVNSFTNIGPACAPRFFDIGCTPWFVVETNDVDRLAFFSNITHNIFYTRNRRDFYRELRDILKPDLSCDSFYKAMASKPMADLLWSSEETNLVEALHDPLLAPRFRRHALWTLKKRFDWPATNTVPEL